MIKVITYGTYDLLHYGHRRLLERAKALGDYLIVGVTSDDYDKTRGKINNQQSLMERVAAIKATGLADEVIAEEYDGQKIDDIRKYGVDIFAIGSDWEGKFDYLNEYCKVIYLPRTEGISSSEIRTENRRLRIGLVGESNIIKKFERESKYVNGVTVVGICSLNPEIRESATNDIIVTDNYDVLLSEVDAVYLVSNPPQHYIQIKKALTAGKHVLCESPIVENLNQCHELFKLAKEHNCVLMEGIKTAYSTAYSRMLLLVKSGKIGDVVAVDATCTSLRDIKTDDSKFMKESWNSIGAWGPTAMLPIFQLLGTEYRSKQIISQFADTDKTFDTFTRINFIYDKASASIKVGTGVKSEGELIISGTKGYVYVPAPWWKLDYFELRFEDSNENKRYFYQLDGEGIRYEIVAFLKSINSGFISNDISLNVTEEICSTIEDFCNRKDMIELRS